jgi:hypothetical protein
MQAHTDVAMISGDRIGKNNLIKSDIHSPEPDVPIQLIASNRIALDKKLTITSSDNFQGYLAIDGLTWSVRHLSEHH